MFKRTRANGLNEKGRRLLDEGELEQAKQLFEQAAAVDPKWSTPLYNLGLLFKKQHNWAESLAYNRRAAALDPKNEAAWWNLGIAATALARWQDARAAWRGFGIQVPDGDGPLDFPCGFGPVRLHPEGDGEVVWGHRLDPARIALASIPFPESGHRWRDIVLNDGEPVGYRMYQGKQVSVFNALQLLEPSPFGTYVARAAVPPGTDPLRTLAELADQHGGSAEDWSTSVRLICKACSEGRVHEDHDQDAAPADGEHAIGIAALSLVHAEEILAAWKEAVHEVAVQGLSEALPPRRRG